MADRIGNWQPKPETAAPPNSPRRPGDPEGAIADAMEKLPAYCTLPGDALEDAIERGDDKAVEECLVAIERNRAIVAQDNARHVISEMDPESWVRSPDSVPFDLRKDGLDAIKLASVMAFDPDVPMKHVLTILNFVKHEALGAPKPVRDALLNAVNELFVQLNKSVIAEFNDRAWELVHQFLAKAPFRI
jgi:hypothetical protein